MPKAIHLASSILASALLSAAAMAAEVGITLHARADVRGTEIAVRDLGAIESDDARWQEKIGRLKVASVSTTGSVGSVSRAQIERQIGLSFPELRDRIRWAGAERVEVRIAGAQIEGAAIEKAARDHLEQALARDHEQVKVEPAAAHELLTVPEGEVSLRPRSCGRENPARRMCVWVDVAVAGAPFKSIPVWFKVEARRKVFAAKTPVASGSPFDPRDFALELRDVAGLQEAPFAPGSPVEGMRVRRPLARGQIVLPSDLQPAPAVTRNQDVTVMIRLGAIVVEAPGIALSEGKVGAVIRVQNPANRETYTARVVDNGVLLVNLR